MENAPESVKRTTEGGQADSSWVLPPELPSGTSVELAILTKANHPTPETLEVLQQLMVRVQESETKQGPVEKCGSLADCGNYKASSCEVLTHCISFTRPQ
jgi:hypothetical protein